MFVSAHPTLDANCILNHNSLVTSLWQPSTNREGVVFSDQSERLSLSLSPLWRQEDESKSKERARDQGNKKALIVSESEKKEKDKRQVEQVLDVRCKNEGMKGMTVEGKEEKYRDRIIGKKVSKSKYKEYKVRMKRLCLKVRADESDTPTVT